jgi:hypothetical protein
VVSSFRLEETSAGPPLKHNMFLCQFAIGPTACAWKPTPAASEQVMHFRLVAEITWGGGLLSM